jgi:nucleoside-diphosphate-sugar epimerase
VHIDFIVPAVNGTLNLLRAASLPTSTIKRFIFTSSTASVSRPLSPPSPSSPEFGSFKTTVFDESDWSQDVELLKEYKEKGEEEEKIPFMVKYRASKTLAERAAWEWVKEKGEGLGWDLVVMNPPFVFGVRFVIVLFAMSAVARDNWITDGTAAPTHPFPIHRGLGRLVV